MGSSLSGMTTTEAEDKEREWSRRPGRIGVVEGRMSDEFGFSLVHKETSLGGAEDEARSESRRRVHECFRTFLDTLKWD